MKIPGRLFHWILQLEGVCGVLQSELLILSFFKDKDSKPIEMEQLAKATQPVKEELRSLGAHISWLAAETFPTVFQGDHI